MIRPPFTLTPSPFFPAAVTAEALPWVALIFTRLSSASLAASVRESGERTLILPRLEAAAAVMTAVFIFPGTLDC
jgi:hypothetical protein